MSIFSSSVKSQIIDPVFTSESRCEFRLANRGEAYLPTMRIGNLGLLKSAQNENTYHFGPGAASVIRRIQLLDGDEELDSLRNVGQWLTFKNTLKTNSQNDNVFTELLGGSIGWEAGATGELLSNVNKGVRTGDAESLGTLDLREVFPILNSVSHLSTSLFKNLRVVIEYNTDTKALVNSQTPTATTDGLKKSVPILIVDEIVDDALVASLDKQMTSASWVAIEHDEAAVPQVPTITDAGAAADEAQQSVNLRINGFQNKAVSRVMISKVYQDLANYVYDANAAGTSTAVKALGQYGSKALHKEQFNMRVNGRNVLAGSGVTSPAAMAMLTADTWGDLNVCPGAITESVGLDTKYDLTLDRGGLVGRPPQNWVGVNRTAPRILEFGGDLNAGGTAYTTAPTAQQGPWVGNSSWVGVGIHDRVTDLQIQLTRTGTPTSARTAGTPATDQPVSSAGNFQALNVHIFAEVAKRIDVSGGDYKISYA